MFAPLLLSCLAAAAFGQSSDPSTFTAYSTFEEKYSGVWGQLYMQDGNVNLKLDRNSGSGFKSINKYQFAFFSALIKLPSDYSAGVVTAFYASNHEDFPGNHDELDFEFLGVVPGMPHSLQTNVYTDGSVNVGREERINLWFDPTADFHRYSILWNPHQLVFFVDDIPIRRVKRSDQLGNPFPLKPMYMYGSIWDGSGWATNGGQSPVNYDYGPFISSFTGFGLQGCKMQIDNNCDDAFMQTDMSNSQDLNPQQQQNLAWARGNFLTYSYCEDMHRYPTPPAECLSSSFMPKTSGYHGRSSSMLDGLTINHRG